MPIDVTQGLFKFLKGAEDVIAPAEGKTLDWNNATDVVREHLSEAMNSRHVAFLMGAGCSSLVHNGEQVGIDTMGPLAKQFAGTIGRRGNKLFANATERRILRESLGLDMSAPDFAANLERLMEVLHSHRFVLSHSPLRRHERLRQSVNSVLRKIRTFLLSKCTEGAFSRGDSTLADVYEKFYRKLVFRDRSLPRPWVFTVNYDLFNETAMDRIGLPYCNGFSGTIERRFNPAVFRYALAEQLDIASRKWTVVDGFVYLCKLHGSISWTEDNHGLFPIRETQTPNDNSSLIIYPTPAKQNASLGSPYSDLFREFHSRVVREQNVLFTVGYRFGDEHVNNIIYQALTIPIFRLVILADPDSDGEIEKLRNLHDPRVWIIGGAGPETQKAHYFDIFVDRLMPEPPGERIDTAIRKVVEDLIGSRRSKEDEGIQSAS